MKTKFFILTQKINRQHIQIAFAILVLILFVLAAGAPSDGGINSRIITRFFP
jgi:hypothetical protein